MESYPLSHQFSNAMARLGVLLLASLSTPVALASGFTLSEVTRVINPTSDVTPAYTFSSPEAGQISYGGDCSSTTVAAIAGNNTIRFNPLAAGTHSNCTITVTTPAEVASDPLPVFRFTIDTVVVEPRPINDTGSNRCGNVSDNFSLESNNLVCADTGVTQTEDGVDANGYPVPAGQDALHGRDVTHNDPGDGFRGFSYTKLDANGNDLPNDASAWVCVRDNVTGLTWEEKTRDGGLRDMNWDYSWWGLSARARPRYYGRENNGTCAGGSGCDTEKYTADVNATNLCGHSDWRVPTIAELKTLRVLRSSLLYENGSLPLDIDTDWFPNTRRRQLWSSDEGQDTCTINNGSCASLTGSNWTLNVNEDDFDYAFVDPIWTLGSGALPVRLVHGANPIPPPGRASESSRFCGNNTGGFLRLKTDLIYTDHGDGTVTDKETGLMWQQCPLGTHVTGTVGTVTGACTSDGPDTALFTWSEAMAAAQVANAAALSGYSDWRVPSVAELGTLLDIHCGYLDDLFYNKYRFPLTLYATARGSASFWTSTPNRYRERAWYVDFGRGAEYAWKKVSGMAVRLVRTGQRDNAPVPLTVTTLAGDEGSCAPSYTTPTYVCTSIRAAVAHANSLPFSGHTIRFAAGLSGTVTLQAPLVLTNKGSLVIDGDTNADGKPDIELNGGGARRVMRVDSSAPVTLRALTLAGGRSDAGAGLYAGAGAQVQLENCNIRGNTATSDGGGIENQGMLRLSRCTVSGNTAAANGGAINNRGTLQLVNSTVSGNGAATGGAIHNFDTGHATLTYATVANNTAGTAGGGLDNVNAATITLTAALIADNIAPGNPDCARSGGTVNASSSLIETGLACVNGGNSGNLVGDAALGPLQDNGGPNFTHMPGFGSPVVDAVACTLVAPPDNQIDQRGRSRQIDLPGTVCDIGAVERGGEMIVTTQVDETVTNGACSLREAVANANANDQVFPDCPPGENGEDRIRFNASVAQVQLGSQLVLGNAAGNAGLLTIDGRRENASDVVLNGMGASRVLLVGTASAVPSQVTLEHLRITGGRVNTGAGMYLWDKATVTLRDCTFDGNHATGGAGGAINAQAGSVLRMERCTLSGNTATANGGGLSKGGSINGGALTILNSTFSGNSAAFGGGISFSNPSVTGESFLTHVTLADNTAASEGGGLYLTGSAKATLNAVLIADNSAPVSPDCGRSPATPIIVKYSLIETGTACTTGVASAGIGNISGDPGLGPLQDHGGTSATHLPGAPGLALDAQNCGPLPTPEDQRGVVRPQGSGCDIGAVELRQFALEVIAEGEGSVSASDPLLPLSGGIAQCGNTGGDCSVVYNGDAASPIAVGLVATPADRWHFDHWSGDCSGVAAFTTVSMDAAKQCIARFGIDTVVLSYSAGEGGTIVGEASQTVSVGADGTPVVAVPDEHSSFLAWSDGVLSAARTDVDVQADLNVTAVFAVDTIIFRDGFDGTTGRRDSGDNP